jgi:hypothetical protein
VVEWCEEAFAVPSPVFVRGAAGPIRKFCVAGACSNCRTEAAFMLVEGVSGVVRTSPIDSVGGYMLVSKAKPCMSKFK